MWGPSTLPQSRHWGPRHTKPSSSPPFPASTLQLCAISYPKQNFYHITFCKSPSCGWAPSSDAQCLSGACFGVALAPAPRPTASALSSPRPCPRVSSTPVSSPAPLPISHQRLFILTAAPVYFMSANPSILLNLYLLVFYYLLS